MTLNNKNQHRATRFEKALADYSDDVPFDSLVDFLTDAMHFCHQRGCSFEDALKTARRHFDAELSDDGVFEDTHCMQ